MKTLDKVISLEGKVALITGAASGFGLATSRLFAEYGASIALVDVKDAEEEADNLRKKGYNIAFFQCDLRDEDQIIKTVGAVKNKFGRIDILFNNAGIVNHKTVVEMSSSEWDLMMEINLRGPFLMSKYVIPIMIKQGGGNIINTGSSAAFKATAVNAAYNTTKGGIVNFTRSIAVDFGKYNIRCNSLNPGGADTAMLRLEAVQENAVNNINDKEAMDAYFASVAAGRPLERIGSAEEMAYAALFLASDMSAWATGSALVVDGGRLA